MTRYIAAATSSTTRSFGELGLGLHGGGGLVAWSGAVGVSHRLGPFVVSCAGAIYVEYRVVWVGEGGWGGVGDWDWELTSTTAPHTTATVAITTTTTTVGKMDQNTRSG